MCQIRSTTMSDNPMYIPILKGKEGEYGALELLDSKIKECIYPLIEVPRIPVDYVNEGLAKTLDEHIKGVAEKIHKCWGDRMPIMVDVPWIDSDDVLDDGTHPVE